MTKQKIYTPDWAKNLTIYEVNIRQYTKGGTFKEFKEHLPRLKELGVGILWLMPIQPIGVKNRKGALGSYYSINNYKEVNPEFGTFEEFKSLVKKIQSLGMKVIIDWVANHTAWDHHWTLDHPEYYTKDENDNFKAPFPEWEDVIDLDYNHPALVDEMISQMEFWVKETNIDGFRCDMAHLVPTSFWNRARYDLDKIKPVFMLAESENHDLLEYGFDTIYNWKMLHALDDMAARKITAQDLLEIAMNEVNYLPQGASLLNFTSNHDENSWQGSAIERLHYFLEPLTAFTFLLPGIPLIYSGQEAGNYRRLKFFDKDEMKWNADKMFDLYKNLIHLKMHHPALVEEATIHMLKTDSPDQILAFVRSLSDQKVIVFANLSGEDITFYLKCDNFNDKYINLMNKESVEFSCQQPISLKPYNYLILG